MEINRRTDYRSKIIEPPTTIISIKKYKKSLVFQKKYISLNVKKHFKKVYKDLFSNIYIYVQIFQ